MFRRNQTKAAAAILAVLVTFAFVRPAFAHHPEIAAQIVCATPTSAPTINYTATAWLAADEPSRTNPDIRIFVDGGQVGTGAFTPANSFSFSGSAPLPAGALVGDVLVVEAIAFGAWGNGAAGGASASVEVVVPYLICGTTEGGTGRFTGGGSQIRVDGVRVTRGLTIHCDLKLSNNLEVNWARNQFHMTEHLTTVECTDSAAIIQAPPPAPLDTLVGVGTGRYNGVDGYTIEFTLVDYGEPGSDDQAALRIYETANPANVVLNVPLQELAGGNLQAHYDQPHK